MGTFKVLEIIISVIFFLVSVVILFFCVYSTIMYLELHSFIKKCDKDFGIGNWTFIDNKEGYVCSFQTHSSNKPTSSISITQIITRECYENDVKINCSEMRG